MISRSEKLKLLALGALASVAIQLVCMRVRQPPGRRSQTPGVAPVGATLADASPPELNLEALDRLQHVQVTISRDLFRFGPPVHSATHPSPPPQTTTDAPGAPLAGRNSADPTRRFPLVFYGYALRQGSPPLAFVLQEDEIHITKQGELIQGRYRMIEFGIKSVTLEDGLTGDRLAVPILEPL